jgi:hypothetical protein
MDVREKVLYHQIHPLKLATDICVTPLALYYLWHHRVLPSLAIGFVPPTLVSLGMLKWTPDLERLKQSDFGHYLQRYMTPAVQLIRLLTLIPMAYGAWGHDFRFIVLGLAILALAWCNGLVRQLSCRQPSGLESSSSRYVH